MEFSSWYTYFTNQILPDYDTDPNKIIYSNLNGYSKTMGVTGNIDLIFPFGLKTMFGFTILDTKNKRDGVTSTPILTEKYSATWGVTYDIPKWHLSIDYTGNLYGPMRLPLLGDLDPRKEYSPIWSIQNIQFTYKKFKNFELYGGVKNLLNWTPNKGNPFIIARANDPFDENVIVSDGTDMPQNYGLNGQIVPNGQIVDNTDNPYALTFDPGYVYGPNQGIRGFVGVRYNLL
jgi:outer membrane receptor for ferrienterochelin and colicins